MSLHNTHLRQDFTIKLSQSVNLLAHDWYDVKTNCYIDEGLLFSLTEQKESAAAIFAQDASHSSDSFYVLSLCQINKNNDKITWSTSKKLAVFFLKLHDKAVKTTSKQDNDNLKAQQTEKWQLENMTKEISDIYNATDDNSKKDSWLIKW